MLLFIPTFVYLILFSFCRADDLSCSPANPCASGCCSNSGFCGLGPSFCGQGNCTSGCDSKSQCDPGWGPQWSQNEKCPLNVCCSEYGFCGTGAGFCGNNEAIKTPSCPNSNSTSSGRSIGYYEGWASRRGCDAVYPEQLDLAGYTHLNFAFALIDPNTFAVSPMTSDDPQMWSRSVALKTINPGLEVWISIGGWAMNDADQPTARTFSNMISSEANQAAFVTSLMQVISSYGFDGVDLDWEYPVAPERGGSPADFENFPKFLSYLRSRFDATGFRYGISVTLPSGFWYMQNFDSENIQKSIDWFNIMSYDLHGTWDSQDVTLGPHVAAHTNLTEIDAALSLLWRNSIDPQKVSLGLGFYGRSFTLRDPSCTTPGCIFSGGGNAGPCTATPGILSYDEILDIIADEDVKVTWDQKAAVKYAVWGGNQWVSYDDPQTLKQKHDYADSLCLGGTMAWALDLDKQGKASAELSALTGLQMKSTAPPKLVDDVSQCKWTDCIDPTQTCPGGSRDGPCNEQCPSGWTAAWSESGAGFCDRGLRYFCCPNKAAPTCKIAGTAPFCSGRCSSSEVKIGTVNTSCMVGTNDVCCTRSASLSAQQQCEWSTCGNTNCPNDKPISIGVSKYGDGGKVCGTSQYKQLCCSDPSPYANCVWNRGPLGGHTCQGSCSNGQTIVATSSYDCTSGYQVLCCDGVSDDTIVAQFKQKLATFVQNPSCPASQLEALDSIYPNTSDDSPLKKRGPNNGPSVNKRDLLSSGGLPLMDFLTSILFGTSYRAMKYRGGFDDVMGPKNLRSDEYISLIERYQTREPAMVILENFCAWTSARVANQFTDHVTSQACHLPWARNTTATERSAANEASLGPRAFRQDLDTIEPNTGQDAQINTGALLHRITETTDIRFLYARVTEYENPQFGLQANLEVVYDLRNAPELQERPSIDIFAVFHFHTLSMDPDPARPADPLYPAIPFFHVYHGQRVRNANNRGNPLDPTEWRVDWGRNRYQRRRGANRRTVVLECEEEDEVWYPGELDGDLLENFGGLLRAQGILGEHAFHNWDPTGGPEGAGAFVYNDGRQFRDWPNTGLGGNGFALAPVDMRPNLLGGNEDWPQ